MISAALDERTAAADELLQLAHGTEAGRSDPYPHYAGMRAVAPLYRSALDGIWYATRYDDCKALLHDPRTGRGPHRPAFGVAGVAAERFNTQLASTMIQQNPPRHTRLRGIARSVFTARRVAAMRQHITALAAPMVDAIAEAGTADVVRAIGFPLPVNVISELVGVPVEDRESFRDYFRILAAAALPDAGAASVAAADEAGRNVDAYFSDLLARRRNRPADDLITALAEARDDNGALTDQEITSTAYLLFAAGYGTTTHLIGNGLLALLRHRGELGQLWADPGLAAGAVEEMLRYDTSVQFVRRIALAPLELGDARVQAGDDIVTLPGAANRDPERFPDPDRFDITRADNAPLSFGWGIHHCLGAALARMEVRTVVELMIARFADIELADPDQPSPRTTWFLRSVDRLPVTVRTR